MSDGLTAAELSAVAVFPLPRLVLFPGTQLPLRFFEPRYLALMQDCLQQGPKLIVGAQLRDGWEEGYDGRPAIHDTCGLGRIVEHREHADGTFDLVLQGVARVYVEEELQEDRSYRRARLRKLRSRLPSAGLEQSELTALYSLATRVAHRVSQLSDSFTLTAAATDDPELLVDRVADQLVADPVARQDLLETLDVEQRLGRLMRILAQLHAQLMGPSQDGHGLN